MLLLSNRKDSGIYFKIRKKEAWSFFLALRRYKMYTNAWRRILHEKTLPARSLKILFLHLRLGIPSDLFLHVSPRYAFLFYAIRAIGSTHLIVLQLIILTIFCQVVPINVTKERRGSGGIDPIILNLYTRWWWMNICWEAQVMKLLLDNFLQPLIT